MSAASRLVGLCSQKDVRVVEPFGWAVPHRRGAIRKGTLSFSEHQAVVFLFPWAWMDLRKGRTSMS